jgi:hypothetical protein
LANDASHEKAFQRIGGNFAARISGREKGTFWFSEM